MASKFEQALTDLEAHAQADSRCGRSTLDRHPMRQAARAAVLSAREEEMGELRTQLESLSMDREVMGEEIQTLRDALDSDAQEIAGLRRQVETLTKERDEARAALHPFADFVLPNSVGSRDSDVFYGSNMDGRMTELKVGDFRRARAVFGVKP